MSLGELKNELSALGEKAFGLLRFTNGFIKGALPISTI